MPQVNPFSINIITPAGAALIAQATAANPIVIVDALSGTTAATDAADLASKTVSFYDGISGTIQASSATNNIAHVFARFGNAGSNPQIVRSVCIRGRLASQTDADAVIIAAESDPSSEIYLPSSDSPAQIIRFIFNFAITDDGTLETVYADGATIADLERFVSMYKAGDPTQGEAQTIKGEKTFDDKARFKKDVYVDDYLEANSILATGRLECSAEAYFGSDVYITGGLEATGLIEAAGFVPPSNDSGAVGSVAKRIKDGYFKYIHSVDVETQSLSFLYGADTIQIQPENGNLSCGGGLYPDTSGTYNLGTASAQWQNIYVMALQLAGSDDVKIYEDDGDVWCKANSFCIGEPGAYGNIYADKINGTIVGSLKGLVESLYDPTNPVGSLAEIEITDIGGGTTYANRGDQVTSGGTLHGQQVSVSLDGVVISGSKWAVLNAVAMIDSTGTKALAVRVE